MKTENSIQKILGIILATLSITISLILSKTIHLEGLSPEAIRTLGVLLATLFLQLFNSFNLCVTCLLSSVLLILCKTLPINPATGEQILSKAFDGYTNLVLFFIIASFGISAAFQKSVFSKKLLALLLKVKKLTAKKITFIFMACACILSSIMSNVAAVVIFIPYLEKYLEFISDEDKRKKTAKNTYIGLAVSALIGGMITPAGSSVNLIGLELYKSITGQTITFVEWMKFGLPLAIIMLFVAFFIINLVFKPENPTEEELNKFREFVNDNPKPKFIDYYIIVVIGLTLIAWILSSWIPQINITITAIIAFALMFIPGFSVLTWKEFNKVNSWGAFFVTGNLITLSNIAISNGLFDFFTKSIFSSNIHLPLIVLLMFVALITFVLMAIIPSAPAVANILIPILIGFATTIGVDPYPVFMVSILCIPNIYLFPLDAPLLACYEKKAFKMFELPKATVWIQLSMVVIAAAMVFVINLI